MHPLLPVLILLASLSSAALAQEPPPPPELEPVPDGSPVPDDSTEPGQVEQFEPEVTIRRREDGVIEEYRVDGRLYMVRVMPAKGLPYYLIDQDGDGNLETRRNELDPNVIVPNWIILRW